MASLKPIPGDLVEAWESRMNKSYSHHYQGNPFPLPSRFPSNLKIFLRFAPGKSLGRQGCSLYNLINLSSQQCMYAIHHCPHHHTYNLPEQLAVHTPLEMSKEPSPMSSRSRSYFMIEAAELQLSLKMN